MARLKSSHKKRKIEAINLISVNRARMGAQITEIPMNSFIDTMKYIKTHRVTELSEKIFVFISDETEWNEYF